MSVFTIAVTCLALNIYHEARGEPIKGMQAVALVTLNRSKVLSKPICEVVHSPNQFSWTMYKPKATDPKAYKLAEKIAIDVLTGKVSDFTGFSTFYHNKQVSPYWKRKFVFRKKIGSHYFYFSLERPIV
jgi:spore germination cell wall hydrolase CwlJ-like protein